MNWTTGIAAWPTTLAGLREVAAAINERVNYHRQREGSSVGLPLVVVRTDYADVMRHGNSVHPRGADMAGQHEFEGDAAEIKFERNRLTMLAYPFDARFVWEVNHYGPEPPIPPGYDEWKASFADYLSGYAAALGGSAPAPSPGEPAPTETAAPTPTPAPTGPLPPGTPNPNSPAVPGPPTTGQDLRLGGGKFNVSIRLASGSPALAWPIAGVDGGYFTFFSNNNPEAWVKYADLTPLPSGEHGLSFSKSTDVDFTITVTDLRDGHKTVIRANEIPDAKWAWFSK
jgi:hypothetical protein